MDNFNLKKYLTENKLTRTSVLREGVEEVKVEETKKEEKPKSSSKEELKAKIKEMIIAELTNEPDEDYEKASREVEYGINPETGEEEFDLKDFFMDDEENSIDEAKKDEEEAPAEEEVSDEEIDTTIDTTDTGEDFNIDTSAVDPNIKAVQDALTQAQAAAKNINDEKLTQQIGNTITMFTRTHIANTEAPVNEEMPSSQSEEYVVAAEDLNTNETNVLFTGPKNKALTAYNNIGARYYDNPEARIFIMTKTAFEQK